MVWVGLALIVRRGAKPYSRCGAATRAVPSDREPQQDGCRDLGRRDQGDQGGQRRPVQEAAAAPPTRLLSVGVQVVGVEAGVSVVGERVDGCHDLVTVCDRAVWCGGVSRPAF